MLVWSKRILIPIITAVVLTAVLWFGLNRYLQTPLPRGGDFTLQSIHGRMSLRSFGGKGVVLYFGYTACPDACPTSLSHLADVFKKLTASEREQIVPVFVSVDWRTDTPKKVDDYVKFYFNGTGIGLMGTEAQIDQVVKQYGTSYAYIQDKKSALGYSIQHGTDFYFIDKSGALEAVAPTLATDEELLHDLKSIL